MLIFTLQQNEIFTLQQNEIRKLDCPWLQLIDLRWFHIVFPFPEGVVESVRRLRSECNLLLDSFLSQFKFVTQVQYN